MKIKKNDQVVVITGKYKSKQPKQVVSVDNSKGELLVKGVNQVYKHVKRGHPKNPSGGRLQMEKPIKISNVMYYCESCQGGVKLGYRYLEDGSKERYCRSCKASAGKVSPPRKKYTAKEASTTVE